MPPTPAFKPRWYHIAGLIVFVGFSVYLPYDYVQKSKRVEEARQQRDDLYRKQWDNIKKFPLHWDIAQRTLNQMRNQNQTDLESALGASEYEAFKRKLADLDKLN